MNIKIHKDGYKELLLRCECMELTHVMSMGYFQNDTDTEFYIHISLNPSIAFFRRIWIGIKYILGIEARWPHRELVLKAEDAKEIKAFTKEFIKEHENKK